MNGCRMISVALLLCCLSVTAKEGFWQIAQQTELATQLLSTTKNSAAKIPSRSLDKLTQLSLYTSVQVDNCSGALVSKQGLVLTNYDCVANKLTTSLQLDAATTGIDTEPSTAVHLQERPLDGVRIRIPQQVENVTLYINRQLDAQLSSLERQRKLRQLSQQLILECQQNSHLSCKLHTDDGGLQYKLVKSLELRDVRLVYAPNAALTHLGANATTSTWPQYSADYVFIRGYVNTKGQAANFSLQNVPYVSQHHLAFAGKGIAEQENIIVAGFPLHSQRYQTAHAVKLQFEQLHPLQLQYYQQALTLLQKHTANNSKVAVKYQQQLQWLNNTIAEKQAQLARFLHSSVLDNKLNQEAKLIEWINESSVRRQLYSQVLQHITGLNQQKYQQAQRDLTLSNLNFVQLPALARQLYQYALLRQSSNSNDSELALAKKNLNISMRQVAENFDSRVDQSLALHFLAEYAKLPAEQRLADLDHYFALKDGFNLEIVRHKLAAIYRGSKLIDTAQREAWLTASVADFQQSQDTLISFAVAMQSSHEKMNQQRQQFSAEFAQAWPNYVEIWQAFNEANSQGSYADANGSLRLTMANVAGYQPKDAVWYQPFSSAKGLIENYKNNSDIQQRGALHNLLTQLQQTEQQNLPINFLSNADITSGHAGAATLNAHGRIVGIVIDGACESVISAWHYDERYSRAIHVDSRYILWQLQQDNTAKALLQELSIVN